MLISITEKCRMNCPHCMDDAKCDSNKFMSFDTFKKAVDFNLKYDPMTITITGGEPTEHPQFWEFLEYLVSMPEVAIKKTAITIVSNGMNLDHDDGTLKKKIYWLNKTCKGRLTFQITTVKGLYPYEINTNNPIFKSDNFLICRSIEQMYPQGRAKDKDYDFSEVKGTRCFNIRSISRQQGFRFAIASLRIMLKFCTPQIGYDGSIKLGESTLCPPASHIDKSIDEINNDIKNFRCNGCKEILEKLPDKYRNAIGEE